MYGQARRPWVDLSKTVRKKGPCACTKHQMGSFETGCLHCSLVFSVVCRSARLSTWPKQWPAKAQSASAAGSISSSDADSALVRTIATWVCQGARSASPVNADDKNINRNRFHGGSCGTSPPEDAGTCALSSGLSVELVGGTMTVEEDAGSGSNPSSLVRTTPLQFGHVTRSEVL